MSTYTEDDIKHETPNFWVLAVGRRGFEVYASGITHSTRVASIGRGDKPSLGLTGAIAEADRRQALHDALPAKTPFADTWPRDRVHAEAA